MAASQDKLAALANRAFKAFRPKLKEYGATWKRLDKQTKSLKLDVGGTVISLMTALADVQYPEADREQCIVDELASVGIVGFDYSTYRDWGKSSQAYGSIGKTVGDKLTMTALRDLLAVPVKADKPTDTRAAVAKVAAAAGDTDAVQRTAIKEERRRISGWTPPAPPTPEDDAKVIADRAIAANLVAPKLPDPNDDGFYLVSLDEIVAVGLFGASLRDAGGKRHHGMLGYRSVLTTGFGPAMAPVNDGSGAADTTDDEPTDAELTAIETAAV